MLEPQRTLNVATWTHRVKVNDIAKERDVWRGLEMGFQFTGRVRAGVDEGTGKSEVLRVA